MVYVCEAEEGSAAPCVARVLEVPGAVAAQREPTIERPHLAVRVGRVEGLTAIGTADGNAGCGHCRGAVGHHRELPRVFGAVPGEGGRSSAVRLPPGHSAAMACRHEMFTADSRFVRGTAALCCLDPSSS